MGGEAAVVPSAVGCTRAVEVSGGDENRSG